MRAGALARRIAIAAIVVFLIAYGLLMCLRILYPIEHLDALVRWSSEHAVDAAMVASLIRAESRFRADAVSPQGAIGLMQIMPATGAWIAARLDVPGFAVDDLYDPEVNLRFGTWYVHDLIGQFPRLEDALAAYNAGPSSATRWQNDPQAVYPETATYVRRVLAAIPVYRFYLSAPWLLQITLSLRR
jgi:soluble lytic murein transglycosylase